MTYYAYFAFHAPLSTVEMGYNPIRENVYETELDITGLSFDENIDKETGKCFGYSKHVKLLYQTYCTSSYFPMDAGYMRNNTYEKKISKLVFDYFMQALEDSPEVVYYNSLNGDEDQEFMSFFIRKQTVTSWR